MIIHDHFDGSARCIECEGPCRLRGTDLDVTVLVRFTLEREALDGFCWSFISKSIDSLLGRKQAQAFRQRAVATTEFMRKTSQ